MKSLMRIFLFLPLLSLVSCLDNSGSSDLAFIEGRVILFDDGTNPANREGMEVRLEEAIPFIIDTTDSNGDYALPDIPVGSYTIIYSKEGYGTFKAFNFNIFGGGSSTLPEFSLGQVSTTEVSGISSTIDGEDVVITTEVSPAGTTDNPRYIRIFFNGPGNVGPEENIAFSDVLTVTGATIDFTVNQGELLDLGFSSQETVFVKAFGDSFHSNNYQDPVLGRNVFPNINPNAATAISFQVP